MTQYGLRVTLSVPYELAVQRATEALKTEGFGVYETGTNESVVAAMAPLVALGIVGDNPELSAVAGEADQRLRRAIASLEATG